MLSNVEKTVNELYHEIIFDIHRIIDKGLSINYIGVSIPTTLIEPITTYINKLTQKNSNLELNIVNIDDSNAIAELRYKEENEDIAEERMEYYKRVVKDIDSDKVERQYITQIAVHPDDYKNNQVKILSMIDSVGLLSKYIEHLTGEFYQENPQSPPVLKIFLEDKSKVLDRVEKIIVEKSQRANEGWAFNECRFIFTRDNVYNEVLEFMQTNRLVYTSLMFDYVTYPLSNVITLKRR